MEEKHEQEERKAEARRKKQAERQERANLTLELERTKAERDMALKKVGLLEHQVGELQSQNTMLVARLGKLGGFTRTDTGSSAGKGRGEISRVGTGSSSSGKSGAMAGKTSPVAS